MHQFKYMAKGSFCQEIQTHIGAKKLEQFAESVSTDEYILVSPIKMHLWQPFSAAIPFFSEKYN